jgi:predicted RNase H-like HicB family nuclease
MTVKYTVVIEKGEKSYGASVPDLPGCIAAAKSRAEVERLIREAIELHIEGLLRDGEAVPQATTECCQVEVNLEEVAARAAPPEGEA